MPTVDAHPHGDFAWYDLFTRDLDSSKSFYSSVFGWTPEIQPQPDPTRPPYVMFLRDGRPVGGGGQMDQAMMESGTPQTWNAYVNVDQLEPVLERVEANHGTIIFPAMDVGDVGRLAYFADPEGAIVALWQAKKNVGAGVVDEPGTVCWVELASSDVDAAAAFYETVFGWTSVEDPNAAPSGYRRLRNGDHDVGGILQMTEEWGDMPAHWSVYFETDDIDGTASRVTGSGGEVKFGPFDAPVGRIAVCADDGGAHFYLIELSEEMRSAR